MTRTPTMLIVLDGWGIAPPSTHNAITQAKTPVWDRLVQTYPMTQLAASAGAVGLPEQTIGNSEVGHMNIGAGRIVYQDLTRINNAIADRSFFANPILLAAAQKPKECGGVWHLMGLLSDGGVHSHIDHLFALLDFARQQKLPQVLIHCFMDGRDTSPHGGKNYLRRLEEKIASVGNAAVATVSGRYYAMDRDKRWDRTALAYHALVSGEGEKFTSAAAGLAAAYAQGVTDEFVLPFVVGERFFQDGDGVCFFNFRADRARQLTLALNEENFSHFERRKRVRLASYVTMTQYDKNYPYPTVFPPQNLDNVFGAVIARAGLKQLRIAETEKYAHVTYFLNGGQEIAFPGEERKLIPSPRDVATYDLKPEMSADAVTEEVLRALAAKKYDVLILNFANPDMVGHSGRVEPTVRAVETVDACLGKILDNLLALGGRAMVTADHGNAEQLIDEHGKPHTAHTFNLVPLILVDPVARGKNLRAGGKLCDIAPTLLALLGIKQPKEMTGQSLCSP